MEKKDCQHQIITWAPGVGGFSVPAESSLLFCFPQVLAFLSLIKIWDPLKAGSFLHPCLSLALSLQLCYQPPLSCECLPQELLKWPVSGTTGCGWSQLSLILIRRCHTPAPEPSVAPCERFSSPCF